MAHYECLAVARTPAMSGPPTLEIVDRFQELQNIAWSDELVGDGLGSIALNVDNILPSIGDRLIDLANNPTELWIYRDGILRHAGPIIGIQIQNNTVNLISRGALYYLNGMFIQGDYKHDNRDQYTIVKDLINQWQNGNYANFGINTANIGVSRTLRDIDFEGDELRRVRGEIELLAASAEGFDFYIDLTTATLGNNATKDLVLVSRKGSDKSDTIFLEGRAINNVLIWASTAYDDMASWVKVLGTSKSDSFTSVRTNQNLLKRFGKWGHVFHIDGSQTQGTTNQYAETAIDLLKDYHIEIGGQNENATVFPFPEARVEDFDSGDTVRFVYDTGFGTFNVARVVFRKFVSVDKSGTERLTVEFK